MKDKSSRHGKISYYHLRYSGDMVWTKEAVRPVRQYHACVKKCWKIDHSSVITLIRALVEAMVLGAKREHIDSIVSRNKVAINDSYKRFAEENDILLSKRRDKKYLARWMGDCSKVIKIGIGCTPLHAMANLALQSD